MDSLDEGPEVPIMKDPAGRHGNSNDLGCGPALKREGRGGGGETKGWILGQIASVRTPEDEFHSSLFSHWQKDLASSLPPPPTLSWKMVGIF